MVGGSKELGPLWVDEDRDGRLRSTSFERDVDEEREGRGCCCWVSVEGEVDLEFVCDDERKLWCEEEEVGGVEV